MSDPFIGEIRLVAYPLPKCPKGWMFCSGAELKMSEYEALFSLIGNIYGGDGKTTFRLPNLNGRVLVHQGQGFEDPKQASGSRLTMRTAGAAGGQDEVALSDAMIPKHEHQFFASTETNTDQVPYPALMYGSDATDPQFKHYISPVPNPLPKRKLDLDEQTVMVAGLGRAHKNLMPGLGLRYIICVTQGLYPVHP